MKILHIIMTSGVSVKHYTKSSIIGSEFVFFSEEKTNTDLNMKLSLFTEYTLTTLYLESHFVLCDAYFHQSIVL